MSLQLKSGYFSSIRTRNSTRENVMHEKTRENIITPVSNETIPFHPSIFDQMNGQHIKKAAMRTHGSHGPSGLDANE